MADSHLLRHLPQAGLLLGVALEEEHQADAVLLEVVHLPDVPEGWCLPDQVALRTGCCSSFGMGC